MSEKFTEYPRAAELRASMNRVRTSRMLTADDVAKMISDETGYHFTGNMYQAIETGVTKNVPTWVPLAMLNIFALHPAELF